MVDDVVVYLGLSGGVNVDCLAVVIGEAVDVEAFKKTRAEGK